MRYLAMLFITSFVLFSGQQAVAYDNKDGEAVITFFSDAQGKKYYSYEFGCTGVERGLIFYITYPDVTNGRILNDMDSAKISTLFGDIKIASKHKLILNNETPDRLAFTLGLFGEDNEKEIYLHGAFIIKDKNNKIIGKYHNKLLCYSFDKNTLEICGEETKIYNPMEVILTTTDGAVISINDGGAKLLKNNYELNFGLDPVNCAITNLANVR